MNPNDGEGPATWEARRQRVKERTGNGNGFGTPLAIAIQLWPTPKSSPSGPDYDRMNREGSGGDDLATKVARGWPTPRAGDGPKGGPNQRGSSGDLMLPSAVQGPVPGQLSPCWVEILQGLPMGWTDLAIPNDALAAWPGWPSGPGEEQHAWEPTRTGTGIPQRAKRLECLGNACVPQQAALLFAAIADVDAELVALATGTAAQDARGRL